jgi:hypothetical protein
MVTSQGWIWQESALSTRVLNFAPSELIWECKSQVLSECGYEPRNAPSLGLARHFYDVEQQPFALWQQLVQSYSARELTQYTDVLPAISGLAQRVRDITGSEYYAGIWGNNIAPSLLWEVPRVTIEGTRPKVPAKYTAPSWSWASIEGCVRTSDSSMGGSSKHAGVTYSTGSVTVDTSFSAMTHVVQIGRVECTVSSKNENPFGAVTGGYIELTSLVLLATLYYKKKFPSGAAYLLEHPAISDKLLPFSPDTELEPFIIRRSRPPMFSVRRSNSIPSQEYRVDVECLMISKGPGATARSVTVDGIVLARSQTNGSQRIRIGFFSFGNASWFLHATQNQTVTIV